MRVVFSNRAYASVLAETTEKIETETGGLFLGTIQDDIWYIIETIDPGPKSIFEVAYFEYDQKYTQHLINKLANLYDKKLSLIGLWHRHPGSFDQFSSTDDGTNAKYASMREEGAISALVNVDPTFRITMYQVERPCRYRKIAYEIGDNFIPDAFLKFKTPERFYSIMDNILHPSAASRSMVDGYHKSASLASFMKFILPQLKECVREDKENVRAVRVEFSPVSNREEYLQCCPQEKLLDEIFDDLSFMADTLGIETEICDGGHGMLDVYQDAIEGTTKLHFVCRKSEPTVTFCFHKKRYLYYRNMFSEAYKAAKAEKDSQTIPGIEPKTENQNGMLSSVIRMIKFNRSEE